MQSTEDKKKKKRDDCLIRKKKGGKTVHARYKNRHAVLNKRTIGKHKKKKKKRRGKKKKRIYCTNQVSDHWKRCCGKLGRVRLKKG